MSSFNLAFGVPDWCKGFLRQRIRENPAGWRKSATRWHSSTIHQCKNNAFRVVYDAEANDFVEKQMYWF